MANNLQIVISALDRTGSGFRSANRNLREIERSMQRTNRSSRQMSAVQEFVQRATGSSLARAAGIAGFIGGVALLTSKIFAMETAWSNAVRSVSNKSLTLGIDAKQLFGIQNAAKSVGLSAEQATSSVEGVTRGYYESTQGRDPQKRMIYQAYGINGLDDRGQFSSERLLEQIAAAGESVNSRNGPLARHRLFEALDASGLEDLLNKGAGGVRDRYARGVALAPSEDDIRHANDYAEAMARLDAQFDKTKQTILGGLAPALTTVLKSLDDWIQTTRQNGLQLPTSLHSPTYAPSGAIDAAPAVGIRDRAVEGLERVGNYLRGNGARTNAQVGTEPNKNIPYAIDYFQSHGLTRTAAIGMTAGLVHESQLDPFAEGDNGQAYGVAQWHPDRAAAFEKWAGHSMRTSTLDEQLGYVMQELYHGGVQEQRAGALLEMAKTPEEAARIASLYYERPKAGMAAADARAATATRLAGLYSGGGSPEQNAQDTAPSRGDGELRVKVELGNLPKGSRAEVSGTPNVKSTVERGSTGSTSQFALGATY
ncbi:membrane protein [Burkholderia sp. SJ98]|nr:membrane protein [Burkholderia sp. SJ98]